MPASSHDLSNRVDTCDFNLDEKGSVDNNLPDLSRQDSLSNQGLGEKQQSNA